MPREQQVPARWISAVGQTFGRRNKPSLVDGCRYAVMRNGGISLVWTPLSVVQYESVEETTRPLSQSSESLLYYSNTKKQQLYAKVG